MLKQLLANTLIALSKFCVSTSQKLVPSSSIKDDGTAAGSPHYNQLGRQPIVEMLETFSAEEFMGYLKGNTLKYTRRAGLKAGTNDQAKANQYRSWTRQFESVGGITLNKKFYTKE